MPRKDANSGPISAQAQQDLVSEGIENFELPKTVVTKIAKSALPDNIKLQKDTVLSLVKGSTVFINLLAATAHDVAVQKQHKSIAATDVLRALELLEFGDMVDRLQTELVAYRDVSKHEKPRKSTGGGSHSVGGVIKKSTVSVSSASIPVPGQSIPSAAASAGETAMSTSLTAPPSLNSVPHGQATSPSLKGKEKEARAAEHAMDVDQESQRDPDLTEDVEDDQIEEDQDQQDDDEEGEEQEIQDVVTLEEEEVRTDAKGLEARDEDERMHGD